MQVIVNSRHPVVKLYLGDLEVDQQPCFSILLLRSVSLTDRRVARLDPEKNYKPRVKTSFETCKAGGYALLKTHPCHKGITERD